MTDLITISVAVIIRRPPSETLCTAASMNGDGDP